MKIGYYLAQGLSFVFHPLLIPTYNVLLLFMYTSFALLFEGQELRILLPIFIFTCVIPFVFTTILRQLKLVKTFELHHREERFLPYFIACLANISLFYFFYRANLQLWFLALVAFPVILILLNLVINLFWKISTHMLAFGGLVGGVLSVSYNIYRANPFILFSLLFILAGCLGVARLALRKTTPQQVYTGFLVGLVVAYLCVWCGPLLMKIII